jgi:redox-sensitive bicupin YhaK (pirin superfamily)
MIGPGDVQWMTAGSGILHEEMPQLGPDGVIDGFQLWVNLPAAQKMSYPRYQEVGANTIPVLEEKGYRIRVVAGTINGLHGPVTEIAAKPVYLDVIMEAGSKFSLPVPEELTVLAYIFSGQGIFGDSPVPSVKMVVFGNGDQVAVRSDNSPLRFMLMAGAPFGEPIVSYGPFVMNTHEEIQQALADLRDGSFVRT